MRLAHLAVVTPHLAGLYETTRDLVMAERALGIDACIMDPKRSTDDRGVPTGCDIGFVESADVLVSHSGLGSFSGVQKPIVHVLHGRPESSFLLERLGRINVYSFLANAARDPRYKRFVTFWEEFVPYWSVILPEDRLRVVPPPVNLEEWSLGNGQAPYDFGGKAGKVNVVCADVWREDLTPYRTINAFYQFGKATPGAKFHLYGKDGNARGRGVLLLALAKQGMLGEVKGWVKNLVEVYRAADLMITPHWIATRSVREALACGCPVVADVNNRFAVATADATNPIAFAEAMSRGLESDRATNRRIAERAFNPKVAAEAMQKVCEEAMG